MDTMSYLSLKLNKTSFLRDRLCNLNIKDSSYGEFGNCDIWVKFRELGLHAKLYTKQTLRNCKSQEWNLIFFAMS